MNIFERSWNTASTSYGVIRQDKELLLFPVIAGVLSLLFSLAMLFPTVISGVLESHAGIEFGPLQFAAMFATYLGLAFITTFSNVCVVYTTRVRLTGGDATFFESVRFGFSRLPQIFGWSMLSATVGLILHGIDSAAERSGIVGQILLSIVRAIFAAAWSIVSVFAIPAMVFHGVGPIDAIKKSTETMTRVWGESLVGNWGMGLFSFLLAIPGVLGIFASFSLLAGEETTTVGVVLLIASITWLVFVALLSGVAKMVYSTALFMYAETGVAPPGFSHEALAHAYARKG
jgi:hypothetical protein